MNIETEITKFSEYIDPERLLGILSRPVKHLSEDLLAIIPSLTIGSDGLSLSSLLLVTRSYICEVRIAARSRESFDFANRKMMFNIRFELGNHDIVVEDKIVASYETAAVEILHTSKILTKLQYAGTEREAWIAEVREAFPIELLMRGDLQ